MRFIAWRNLRNRFEVRAWAGLASLLQQSSEEAHELGISKFGNRHIQTMTIEIA